jgi:U3 small nucleolar RNA-associated protein 25
MQNWEHVTFLMEKLHCRPTKSHGVDFSRVRLWTLDELSPLYRQTLLFSSTPLVELNAVFNRSCHNFLGKVSTVNPVKSGTISGVLVSGVPMTFHRVDTSRFTFLSSCSNF